MTLWPYAIPLFALSTVHGMNFHETQRSVLQLVHEAIDKCAERGLPWALLTMLIDASFPEDGKAAEVRNAQHKAQSLVHLACDGLAPIESMPFLELESLLIDLHFGELALRTHTFTVSQPGIDTVKTQVSMCKAQAVAMSGDCDTAVSILKNVVRSCGARFPPKHKVAAAELHIA